MHLGSSDEEGPGEEPDIFFLRQIHSNSFGMTEAETTETPLS